MDPDQPPKGEDDGHGRPLVMERFARFGVLALILAPLLVVTLSAQVMSRAWAIIVFVGGLVAIVALRNRDRDDGGD